MDNDSEVKDIEGSEEEVPGKLDRKGPQETVAEFRAAFDSFKRGYNHRTYDMRKRVEELIRTEQALSSDLETAKDLAVDHQRETRALREGLKRASERERSLHQEIERLNSSLGTSETEIQHIATAHAASERENGRLRREGQEWESKCHRAERRILDAESLVGIRKARGDSLAQQLDQLQAQLKYSREEVESLRRQRRISAKEREEKVSLLMQRIVQAERASREGGRNRARADEAARERLEGAERQVARLKNQVAEREGMLHYKRELFILRSKQKALESQNKGLVTRVNGYEAERKMLLEQVWRARGRRPGDMPPPPA